ncbi:hypothetical protein [Streptomyces sp. NRRL B-3648]|uniref:hypothetical protein n=1 Tax=Streptomyces sp. NRRL B-3648 TaxID=1519493 RepID=UPI000B2C0C29|nr:hypothetical protein [Streptomyces sp. NRRL B-3648]
MILHVDRVWLLEAAQQYLRADPDVTDWGALAAAVARHADEVMGTAVYQLWIGTSDQCPGKDRIHKVTTSGLR